MIKRKPLQQLKEWFTDGAEKQQGRNYAGPEGLSEDINLSAAAEPTCLPYDALYILTFSCQYLSVIVSYLQKQYMVL